jgi:3-oxoacyl-[acyl-carrier protein] reductase
MELGIKNRSFIVCGATSGFGHAIALQLIAEGARVIAVARGEEKLRELEEAYPSQVSFLAGDISRSETIAQLVKKTESITVDGILVNAGGPPAKSFQETTLDDWDNAYRQLLRWKIELTRTFLPHFLKNNYGRILYIESSAVKQPLEHLILSTSMRLSVVGFVKTISQEIPDKGITFNVLAPGYHYTPAVERLIQKKAQILRISSREARLLMESDIPMKKTGNVSHLASLAVWLLSPLSDYITGQVYAIDGAVIKSTL